jgi:RNA polymerase II subunit A small phosphatase-like protein
MPRFDKILVLDIDETLINSSYQKLDRDPDFQIGPFYVYKRPGVEYFLEQCFEWFTVGFWTTATKEYATYIADNLISDITKLAFLWTRRNCERNINFDHMFAYYIKDISKLCKEKNYDPSKVIVLDDLWKTAEKNPENLVLIDRYEGNNDDEELYRVLPFLGMLGSSEKDIREMNKEGWKQ